MNSDKLNSLFHYDPLTGGLTYKSGPRRGKPALSTLSEGYRRGRIKGKYYKAHRVIWCMVTGAWPLEVDHEDGDGGNNRWLNLREVTHQLNSKNLRRYKNNKSGVSGVSFYPRNGKWLAKLQGKHLGYFSTKELAIAARKQAETDEGFHPNHGRA